MSVVSTFSPPLYLIHLLRAAYFSAFKYRSFFREIQLRLFQHVSLDMEQLVLVYYLGCYCLYAFHFIFLSYSTVFYLSFFSMEIFRTSFKTLLLYVRLLLLLLSFRFLFYSTVFSSFFHGASFKTHLLYVSLDMEEQKVIILVVIIVTFPSLRSVHLTLLLVRFTQIFFSSAFISLW